MTDIETLFNERVREVEAYLDFLVELESQARSGPPKIEGAERPITPQQQRMLYSSVYLQLYSLVEATMSVCLDAVSTAANGDGHWLPRDLSSELRREWARVVARTHVDMTPTRRLDYVLGLCEHLITSLPVGTFSIEKGGGGNWDDRAIEKFSDRLGVALHVDPEVNSAAKLRVRNDLGSLQLIKDFRNQLAHGTISFSQCAEDDTVEWLVRLKDTTVLYLLEVISAFNRYLVRSEYLVEERRTA